MRKGRLTAADCEEKMGKEKMVDFGAVYFRYSAPAKQDWERDYRRASEDGITHFRHWVPWAAIETASGVFDWSAYDEHVALGNKYGIKTVLAEMSTIVPDWFYAQHQDARITDRYEHKRVNRMNDSSMAGGVQSMCMDHRAVRDGVSGFLKAMGEHFRGVEGIIGYDVWNECSMYNPEDRCYCEETEKAFQEWLKEKYKTLENLHSVWCRHSYTDWSQIRQPRSSGPMPEFFDMLRFQNDNLEKWFQFRIDVLRNADPTHKIIAHGNGKSHSDAMYCCGDDWRYAKHPDIFGYTLWYANNCTALMGGDMIRLASGEKEFWRAEAIGDATWEHRSDKTGPELHKDEMSSPDSIRIDAMMSLGTGASAYINPRYRGLNEGHLFQAYGWYAPNGDRTPRSEEIARLSAWSHSDKVKELWSAWPVKGQVGLLLLEDSQALCYALFDDTDIYADCLKGSYQAFVDSGIQADIVRMSQIDGYDMLYIPYPVGISDQDMKTLETWVRNGGTLIGEGCFGYFNDRGHAMENAQPNRGFGEVFGCEQERAHLGPDANKELTIDSVQGRIRAGVYRQAFRPTSGQAEGYYENGEVAIVSNRYGEGRTLLVGSMPGYGYHHHADEATRRWLASLLGVAGKQAEARMPYNGEVTIRFWSGNGEKYAWIFNFADMEQSVEVEFRDGIGTPVLLRGSRLESAGDGRIRVRIPKKDAAIVKL